MKYIITDNYMINMKRVDEIERMGEIADANGGTVSPCVGVLYKNGNAIFIRGDDAVQVWNKVIAYKFKKLGKKNRKMQKQKIKEMKDFVRTTDIQNA